MFLVTGITGHVGGAAARKLLEAGKQVRALVRDTEKASAWAGRGVELVKGEWNDSSSVAAAQAPSPGFAEAKAVIASYVEALRQFPPPRVVALSSIGSEKTSGLGLITSTHLMEQGLSNVDVPMAFVRAGGFYENFLYGLQTGQGGVLPVMYLPTTLKIPMIASEDIGAQVAKLLMGDWDGHRIIELGTPITADGLAAELGVALGREVKAQAVPREAWTSTLEHMGMPKGTTWAYEEMLDGFNSGWIAFGVEGTEPVAATMSAKELFEKAKAEA
jgi:uncharacterized protein YbjT (DUF2867 family)